MKKMLVVFAVCFAVFNAEGAVDWDIYDDASIRDGDVYLTVNIYDNPPEQTVVNMTGGDISLCSINNSATLNYTGGDISTLQANNQSVVMSDSVDIPTMYLY